MRSDTRVVALLAAIYCSSAAFAQWTVTNLHPAGATESRCEGIGLSPGGVREVGYVTTSGIYHAAMWSGSVASFTDLQPSISGITQTMCAGISGSQQIGTGYLSNGYPVALLWSGTPSSATILNPPFPVGQVSIGYAISGGVSVGSVGTLTSPGSCEWNGTTLINLSGGDAATGIDGANIVGTVRTGSFPFYGTNAVMWTGSPPSLVSLHPASAAFSSCAGVSGNQQVGTVVYGSLSSPDNAALWTGTAASIVDLHPAGAASSECTAVNNGTQVGTASYLGTPIDPNNPVARAALWNGTAASYENLHNALPASFSDSYATGVYKNATTLYVVGYGYNTATSRTEALLWTRSRCVSISGNPQPLTLCQGSNASFTVSAGGDGTLTYHWRKNTALINTATNPSAATPTLVLMNIQPGDHASYDCQVTNTCGTVTSQAAALNVLSPTDPSCGGGPACDPDVNQDGVADQGDVDYLINVIAGGANPTNIEPDFNQDGVADQGDIDALVNVIAGGPCP
ncbi:MAG: hypothetical protein GC200_04545 [Tepidisphaera sp.]|nr:hypothetical protein [Tepidisphaera sp.]